MGDTKISVIIPSWNRCDLLLACLASVRAQGYPALEVIVVNDASTDDTVSRVTREYPEVKMIHLAENRGFARAVNRGIAAAEGDWLLLLNNDVTLAPRFLERMLFVAEAAGADMVAPLILWRDDPDTIYSAGDAIRPNGRPEAIGFRAARGGFEYPKQIFGVSAAAGLYRRALFHQIGALDESFHAYFEDADFCFRARLAGATAALAPEAVAYHVGSASISDRTWWRARQCYRNHALLVVKNLPTLLIWEHLGAIMAERLHQARMCFSAARAAFGFFGACDTLVRTWWSLTWALPAALRARATIQHRRVLPHEDLARLMRWNDE